MLGTDTTRTTPLTQGGMRPVDQHVSCQAHAQMLVVGCPNRAAHVISRGSARLQVCAAHVIPAPR